MLKKVKLFNVRDVEDLYTRRVHLAVVLICQGAMCYFIVKRENFAADVNRYADTINQAVIEYPIILISLLTRKA